METATIHRPPIGRTLFEGPGLELRVRRAAWAWLRQQVVHFVRGLVAELRARRAIRELETMSDRDLRDVGLTRDDVYRLSQRILASGNPDWRGEVQAWHRAP